MKEVYLIVKEKRDIDYGSIRTDYTYYEMPYTEEPTEENVLASLKDAFSDTEVLELYNNGVVVAFDGTQDYFPIVPAIKIGTRYFELKEMPSYTRN